MNLTKLFEAQKKLREHINYNGEDRFEKLILALLVEIGECANEWRGFKFWSQDQEPRTNEPRPGKRYFDYNPLLEEYVDGLHFVLELGIELDIKPIHLPGMYPKTITIQFIEIQYMVSELVFYAQQFGIQDKMVTDSYQQIFDYYLFLGKSLGFSPEQIEQAYYDKNQINHERQNNGY